VNKLNKYEIIFVFHVILFLLFAASINTTVFADHNPKPIQLFGLSFDWGVLFVLGYSLLLFVLIIISWRGAVEATSQRLKNYFRTFRWLGPCWLIFNLGLLTAHLWQQLYIQSLFASSPN
jgi:hypothetical protein